MRILQVENYFEMSGIRVAGSEALQKRQDINKEVGVYYKWENYN